MHVTQVPRYRVTVGGETASVGTADELSAVLDALHGREDRAVLEQLSPNLAGIVGGPAGLMAIMRSLEPADQEYLVASIGGALTAVIREARHLRDLLATLAEARVKTCILGALGGDGLRALVHTASDLAGLLEWLYGEEDLRLRELIGAGHVRRVVRTAHELASVLSALDCAGQQDVIAAIGWEHVTATVRDGRDLACLMRAMPAGTSAALLNRYSREQLRDLIRNAADWTYLYDRLEPAEASLLLDRMGVK